MTASYLV